MIYKAVEMIWIFSAGRDGTDGRTLKVLWEVIADLKRKIIRTRPSITMRILKYLCIWTSDTREHCFQCPRLAYLELWPNLYSFMCICVFVFACQTNGNFVFEVLIQIPFRKYSTFWATLTAVVFVYFYYLCICRRGIWEHCFWGPLTITFSKI